MSSRYKILPLSFPFDMSKKNWLHCVREENRIEPVFNRNGYYYDRYEKRTWLEIDGEAWTYLSPVAFLYDLDVDDGNNWLDWHVWEAIGVLIKARLADKRLKHLYYIQRDRRDIKNSARISALGALGMKKRFYVFLEQHRKVQSGA